ncbi:MAG: hypothetical protein E7496_05410 [Ruminococcus sp.]|nr:hypothetical protein [Ruminococcus sp.]
MMNMDVKYRSYGENRPLMIVIGIVAAVGLIWMEIFDKLFKISMQVSMWFWVLYLLLLIILGIMTRIKSRFVANNFNVTFTRVFSRKIVIDYLDIDEITVYTIMQRGRRQHIYHNFYVEVIEFKTIDGKEYVFKNIMDISPDSRVAAMLGMNKIFEMGKFKVLQKFIEQKKHDFYSQDDTIKRS